MNEEKTICLCAIVRNESKVIKRLIDSCHKIIDYWVIIDTGSTDDTRCVINEVMRGYKIKGELHKSKWVNFGHNRSELMKMAKGKADYLLLADADFEYIIDPRFNKKDLKYDWYHLRYTGDIDFSQVMLVKGDKDWKYVGVTHEYIIADNLGESPELRTIKINHRADGGTRHEKLERDSKLLEKAIVDSPDDSRNFFYLAQTYANMKEYDKAIDMYEQRIRKGGWPEEVYYSLFQIGVLQYHKKNMPSAIIQLMEAYSYRPTRFEALYMLGLLFREQKKYHLAKIYQEEIMRMPYPVNDKLFIHRNNKEVLAEFELSICYYWIGEYENAKICALNTKAKKNIPESVRKQNEQNLGFIEQKLKSRKDGTNDVLYISSFTADTPYEEEVKNLKASLDKFGLPYEILGMRNKGSWVKNTQMKPLVIKTAMDKHNRDVVWLDADAVVKEDPVLFKTLKCDVAFHYLKEWNEKMTGTMYFKNSTSSREILNKWISLNNTNNEPDAKNFQSIMDADGNSVKVYDLPKEYINIEDNPYLICEKPVITHYQASRRFKNAVKFTDNNIETKYDIIKEELTKLIQGYNSCAVIGNGPFKTDLSEQIEKAFVMRCNNFKIGPEEIGQKIDLNISSLYYEIVPKYKVDYPILGVLPISESMYQKYTNAKQMHRYWLENGTKLIKKGSQVMMYGDLDKYCEVFKEVTKEINAFPTVGIMGIATARWLGFKKIIVTGFTFFQSEKSHYFLDEKVKPSSHHNVLAERDLLQRWVQYDDIEYVLDEMTKENIREYESSIRHNAT